MNINLTNWTFIVGKRTYDRNNVETTQFITVEDVVVSGNNPKEIMADRIFVKRALLTKGIAQSKHSGYTPISVEFKKQIGTI